MVDHYQLWLSTPNGDRVALLDPFVRLDYEFVANGVHLFRAQVPANLRPLSDYQRDSWVEVWRDGRLEGCFLLRRISRLVSATGVYLVELWGVGLNYILGSRIVAYPAGGSFTSKSGKADDVIGEIIQENFIAPEDAARAVSGFGLHASDSLGPVIIKSFARRNVLRLLQEISETTAQLGRPVFFDVRLLPDAGYFEFRTYYLQLGTDRTYGESAHPVLLSPELGTLADVERAYDFRDEITAVYVAGRGLEADRTVVSAVDDARAAGSPWNRRESFVDARFLTAAASLDAEASAELRSGQPQQALLGTVISLPQCAYGVHWFWGDRVTAAVDGDLVDVLIDSVRVVVEQQVTERGVVVGRGERITAGLRIDSGTLRIAPGERVSWQLSRTSAAEDAYVSQVPQPLMVPQAGADGKIALGWLPDGIGAATDWTDITSLPATFPPSAHAATHTTSGTDPLAPEDIGAAAETHGAQHKHGGGDEVATATPAAHAIPQAGAGGTIADGWLSAAIARLVDLTWANVSGKPSSFSPSAHAATHRNGGSDEIAVATPAANAIPKAGAGGTIADGWLSAAIARLVDLTWANVSGKPSSFSPSAHAATHKHGGGDEIAVATPTANGVPKAGAGGTLDAGWIPAGAGGGLSGSGTTGQVAYWSGGAVAGDAGMVYDSANDRLTLGGDLRFADYLYGNSKLALGTYDTYLRLNNAGNFTNGVYTPGALRADGALRAGNSAQGGAGDVAYTGDLVAVRGGTGYTVNGLVMLSAPVTATNWNAAGKATGTYILSIGTEFAGVPTSAVALLLYFSASWASAVVTNYMAARARGSTANVLVSRSQAANINVDAVGIVPVSSGQFDIYVNAATNAGSTSVRAIGYFI